LREKVSAKPTDEGASPASTGWPGIQPFFVSTNDTNEHERIESGCSLSGFGS